MQSSDMQTDSHTLLDVDQLFQTRDAVMRLNFIECDRAGEWCGDEHLPVGVHNYEIMCALASQSMYDANEQF